MANVQLPSGLIETGILDDLRRLGPKILAELHVIACTPEQHIWLLVPQSWVCQCGEMEVVNGDDADRAP